jgi:hypothetical protein
MKKTPMRQRNSIASGVIGSNRLREAKRTMLVRGFWLRTKDKAVKIGGKSDVREPETGSD